MVDAVTVPHTAGMIFGRSAALILLAVLAGGCQPDHAAAPSVSPSADAPRGVGVVQAVDAAAGTITIAHEPMETLGWPAMTMPFKIARPELLENVTVGERIEFTLESADMTAPITAVRKTR